VVEEHADGGHVLLEGGGRQAVGLGDFEIVTNVQGTDVLYARPPAILQKRDDVKAAFYAVVPGITTRSTCA